jgi:integrase
MRLKLGLGRGDNDLVFSTWDGRVRKPNAVTRAFKDDATAAGLPHLTLHGLRHTHVSKLLANGVPVNVVAQRVGHANPTVTLNIYAHVMEGADDAAAAVFDTALRKAIEE